MKRLYNHREVSRLAGVSESQIRYWDKVGLIPHSRQEKGRLLFDFKALVAFRTVKAMLEQGVPTRRIRKCIEVLKRRLPEVSDPLAELRIRIQGDRIVVDKDKVKFTPEGQILIDFEGVTTVGSPAPLPVNSTEELFFQAMDLEEDGKWEEAEHNYVAVLNINPGHVDSLVNLGTIRYREGFRGAAERFYRTALRIDPDHVEANYNLANLMEEQGDLDNAVLFYAKTIHEDPEFADAHFNLGRTLERTGDLSEARKHWRAYLELDGTSRWAEYVRSRLEEED